MAYYGNAPADVALVIGQDVITTTEIQDATIVTADIASDAVTATKIDDDGTGFQMGSLGLGTAVSGSHKLTVGGTATFSGAITGTLDTASQTAITSVGTIGTGVWQGTAVASAYLDADTAHLSTTQTFSGAKTFSALSTHNSDIYIKGGGTLRLYQTGDANWGNLLFDSSVGFNFGDAVRVGGSLIAGTSSAFASSSHYFVGGVDGSKSAMRITSSTYGQPILDVHGTSTQTNDAFGLRVRAGNGSAWISDFQSSDGTSRFKVLANGSATFTGQIINTGDCSFRNGEILMANDRFDVLGGQDRRITLGTIGTPGQNSSHNVRGRSDGLYLNAPSKIVTEINGTETLNITSSTATFAGEITSSGGIQTKGQNGNNPSGDWYDIHQKFFTYKHIVTSTHVTDGYFSVSHSINRGNVLGVIPNHYGYNASNVNNLGVQSGFIEKVIMYADSTLRVFIGNDVQATDRVYLTMIVEGNTG